MLLAYRPQTAARNPLLVLLLIASCDKPAQPGPPPNPLESGTRTTAVPSSDEPIPGSIIEELPLLDPVCAIELAGPTEISLDHAGRTYYFETAECRNRFAAEPDNPQWVTGGVGQACICTIGRMANCPCAHCSGRPERCDCMQ